MIYRSLINLKWSSVNNQELSEHLNEFLFLKGTYSKLKGFEDLDTYGFKMHFEAGSTQLMLFALTHGNEVIGLPIINEFLKIALSKKTFNFAVQLNNLSAFFEGKRFIQSDLNRCFQITKTLGNITNCTLEQSRALEIQNIILKVKPQFVIDLHQTVEASESVFSIIPEDPSLIKLAEKFSKEIPIVCFANSGFSKAGLTLIEYAKTQSIPALVFELGQKGLNGPLTLNFVKKIDEFITLISRNQVELTSKNIEYYKIIEDIPYVSGYSLTEGLKSFQKIEKNQILTQNNEINSPEVFINNHENAVIIFPRYKEKKQDEELGLIAIKQILS